MIDLDKDLKNVLDSMAGEVEPAVLSRRAVGRAHLRRYGVAALAGAGLVLLVAVSLWMSLDLDRPEASGIDGGPARPAEHGEGAGPPPSDMRGDLVASGVTGDTRWWISAFVETDGALCTETATEGPDGPSGGSMGCGDFDPDRHPVGLGYHSGDGVPRIAAGDVPEHTARVVARLPGGDEMALPLYPAPPSVDLPVKFYVMVPMFPEVMEFSAYDGQGTLIGTQEVGPMGDDSVRLTPTIVVREGAVDGEPWVMKAYLERINGEETACTELLFGFQEKHGGGGGCHINSARGDSFGYSEGSYENRPDVVSIIGSVTAEVELIRVETEEAGTLTLEPFEAQDRDLEGHRFFVGWLRFQANDDSIDGTIRSLDDKGNTIDSFPLCMVNAFGVDRGGTCGP